MNDRIKATITKEEVKKICYKLNSLWQIAIISIHSKQELNEEEKRILDLLYYSPEATITNIAKICEKSTMDILDIYLRSSILTCAVYMCYCSSKYGEKYTSFEQFYDDVKFQYNHNCGEIDHSIFDSNNIAQTKDKIIKILTKLEATEILNLS